MLLLNQRIEIFAVILEEALDTHGCLRREADLERVCLQCLEFLAEEEGFGVDVGDDA